MVVLLDLQMPGLDGFGFLDGFRAAPEGAVVPVIVMTPSQDTVHWRIQRLGDVLLLKKPSEVDTLLAAVWAAVRWYGDEGSGGQRRRGSALRACTTGVARLMRRVVGTWPRWE